MAYSKAAQFPENHQAMAEICKAVSHPARLLILTRIMNGKGFVSHSEITKEIPLNSTTISQHLRTLRQARIVTSRNNSITSTEHKLNDRYKHKEFLQLVCDYINSRHEVGRKND